MLIQGTDGMCGDLHLQVTTSLNPRPIIPVAANFMACLQLIISDKAVKTVKISIKNMGFTVYNNIYTYMVFETFNAMLRLYSPHFFG